MQDACSAQSAAPAPCSPQDCDGNTSDQPSSCALLTADAQVVRSLRKDEKPVVIDADGLHILKQNLDLLKVWCSPQPQVCSHDGHESGLIGSNEYMGTTAAGCTLVVLAMLMMSTNTGLVCRHADAQPQRVPAPGGGGGREC